MTVKELKQQLDKYPDNMDVFLSERKTEFAFGLLNSIYSEEVMFVDGPTDDDGESPKEIVVILDEE